MNVGEKMRAESVQRRIQHNIKTELAKLPHLAPRVKRPKAEIDAFIARLRTLNAFLWKKL